MNKVDIEIGEEYYKKILSDGGYENMRDEVKPIDFQLGTLKPSDLSTMWFCHYKADKFATIAGQTHNDVLAITGIGLSGTPHLGTLSQIIKAVKLQKYGRMPVKFVLGDLDAFNGKGTSLSKTKEIGEQTRRFMLELGFIEGNGSELRDQYDELDILRTMYLCSHFMTDTDFESAEEDLHGFYVSQGKVDSTMTYRRKLSLALMVAGWYHQLLYNKKKHLLITLGIDEHKYVKFSQTVLEKMKISEMFHDKLSEASIAAMYSTLIKGFNDFPKMSKSMPNSGITLDYSADAIRNLILNGEGAYDTPMDNIIFQCISNASLFSPNQIQEAFDACTKGGKIWEEVKQEYADHVCKLSEKWKKISERH